MPKRRRGSRSVARRAAASPSHTSFERLVERAVAAIPDPFRAALAEVAIVIGDEPTPDQRRENELAEDEQLYGLYEGVPRTESLISRPMKIALAVGGVAAALAVINTI